MESFVCSQCTLGTTEITLAIGVKSAGPNQRHSIIVYSRRGKLNELHLGWNRLLINRNLSPGYLLAVPRNIDKRRLLSIAAKIRQAASSNDRNDIPYGFGSPENRFDEFVFKFDDANNEFGLTCSTFVYSLCRTAGWHLLNYSEWKERDGDEAWRQKILGNLKNGIPGIVGAVSDADFKKAEQQQASIRIRPMDVLVSVNASAKPASFEEVNSRVPYFSEQLKVCESS